MPETSQPQQQDTPETLLGEAGAARRKMGQGYAQDLSRRLLCKIEDLIGEDELGVECPRCGCQFFAPFKGIAL